MTTGKTLSLTLAAIHTNRPPKGDRSEGFYIKISIFLNFETFWPIFLKNKYFTYEKWVGNTQGMSRIYLEVVSDLKSVLKSLSLGLKT